MDNITFTAEEVRTIIQEYQQELKIKNHSVAFHTAIINDVNSTPGTIKYAQHNIELLERDRQKLLVTIAALDIAIDHL